MIKLFNIIVMFCVCVGGGGWGGGGVGVCVCFVLFCFWNIKNFNYYGKNLF